MPDQRALDVVLFGATGFVGRLTAGYLARHAPEGVRIALAGRSEDKLSSLRSSLGGEATSWPLVVADTGDPGSLAAMAEATRVVATTVGPYRRHGLPLVEACVRAATDYADLTGEVLFIRDAIDCLGEAAVSAGCRVVHACGFDAIPSDLGVAMLHETSDRESAGDLEQTTLVATMKGGFSGGTIATMKDVLGESRTSATARRILADPYALSPDRSSEPDLGPESESRGVGFDREFGTWVGPFVMAPFNTRIVRRSNALQGWAYGRGFRYREIAGFGSGLDGLVKAGVFTSGLSALGVGLQFRPSRTVLDRILPAPGRGPSERSRERGFFRMEIHTRTANGTRYVARVGARGDPGYAATSVMLGESALCLALDRDRLPSRAGILTPATGMGDVLIDRLRAKGFIFETERQEA
jgi:short subunit dehydrogenase-like uncharacterized protein